MQKLLEQAVAAHQRGDLDTADRLYRKVLRTSPRNADALHLRGVVAQQQDDYVTAIELISRALRLEPTNYLFRLNIGKAMLSNDDSAGAVTHLKQAARHKEAGSATHYTLGRALLNSGSYADALVQFDLVLKQAPDHFEATAQRGDALKMLTRYSEAVRAYRQALTYQPNHAGILNNLGVALKESGELDQAIEAYQAAVAGAPEDPLIHFNLGIACQGRGDFGAAVAAFLRAVELQPDFAEAWNNLGLVYRAEGRWEAALAAFEKALQFNSRFVEALSNRGEILVNLGQDVAAEEAFESALAREPENPSAHWNRGLLRLSQGRLEDGWADFEYRWQLDEYVSLELPKPRWDGSPLAGRTLLVVSEQGYGDAIQFFRYLSIIDAGGGKIILRARDALVRLFQATPGAATIIGLDRELPDYDTWIPILSLPGVFTHRIADIPNEIPYLAAEPVLVSKYASRIRTTVGEKSIALVWAGRPSHENDRWRSCPFDELQPLFHIPGMNWYSLQKGAAAHAIESSGGKDLIQDISDELSDFAETAAAIVGLDLVITVDTAVAHLAGALGKPVWVLLPFRADWRWLQHRNDSPWYRTATLFRQEKPGDWAGVIQQVRSALENL